MNIQTTAPRYVMEPAPVVALPIARSEQLFPVLDRQR